MNLSVAVIGSRGYPSTYGGFETFVRRLAPYLRDRDVDVTVYAHGGLRTASVDRVDGITVLATPGVSAKSAATLTHGATAFAHARRSQFDAALVLNVANGFFLPLLRRANVPTAVNVDGIEWERGKWGPLGRRVFLHGARMTARSADAIIVDSRAIGHVWREAFGRESVFLPYGADVVDEVSAAPVQKLAIEPGSYILTVARLVPENNVELLLDAVEQLDVPVPVVVVGSANYASPVVERLRRLADERPEFYWLGHVHDQGLLASLWAHARVYFHGHSVGGTNPALLQALGYGAPVVAYDSPYNREVLEGFPTIVGADAAALAAELSRLVADDATCSELRDRGRRRIRQAYQWDTVCGGYLTLLRGLAERREVRR
jgi:glycosyltransferase involved in cell wall biosynthesis